MNTATNVPANIDVVAVGANIMPTPLNALHRACVSDTHTVVEQAENPRLKVLVADTVPKLSPENEIVAPDVETELRGVMNDTTGVLNVNLEDVVPTREAMVSMAAMLCPLPSNKTQITFVWDTQVVVPQNVFPTTIVGVGSSVPKFNPDNVTLIRSAEVGLLKVVPNETAGMSYVNDICKVP